MPGHVDTTEMNGIRLVMLIRKAGCFGPYLAAIDRIHVSEVNVREQGEDAAHASAQPFPT
jgi:hypothetical protein